MESSSHYQELATEAALAVHEAETAKNELLELRNVHDSLTLGRDEWEKSIIVSQLQRFCSPGHSIFLSWTGTSDERA